MCEYVNKSQSRAFICTNTDPYIYFILPYRCISYMNIQYLVKFTQNMKKFRIG